MSGTEGGAGPYHLRVERRGVVVTVNGAATIELFEAIMDDLVRHPDFTTESPTVWDMRETDGFGQMSMDDLSRLMEISAERRRGSTGYRVAMVAGRAVDFGVGRMMEAVPLRPDAVDYRVFRDLAEAEDWAFQTRGDPDESGVE